MSIVVVFYTMIELFIILVIGYIITKINMVNQETGRKLSALVVNVTLPALIIASVASEENAGSFSDVMYMFLMGLLFYAALPLFAFIMSKVLWCKPGEKGTYQFMLIFSNSAFMGYPVLEAMFGEKAIFMSAIFNIPFNLVAFTYGIRLICMDSEENASFQWKKLINPGIIASLLALLIYGTGIHLPMVIVNTCSLLGNVTTPVSMLVLGISLAAVPMKQVFEEWKVYPMTVIRLLLMPLLTFFVISLFTKDIMLNGVATMTMAMPVASMTVMMSNQYKGNIKLASIGVFISTLCSVVTIPIIAWLLFAS